MSADELERIDQETLDPQDWDGLRQLGYRMVDDMLSYLETVRERPVWQPVPPEVKDRLNQPAPQNPQGAEQAYEDFISDVLPYPMGNSNPRFWAWVMGGGTPFGAMAEMMAATINPNMGGGDHGGNYVERQVLDWCKEMLGFPLEASGLLTSGGSMANLVGLTVARNSRAGFDIRSEGVAASPRPMTIYSSVETHSSNQKAAELLGLGNNALRKIPVNDAYQVDINSLREAIRRDKADGFQPICIIGNAGTVNTGAVDDLQTLADICQEEGMWFHVDGAFGALAAIVPELRHLTAGMDRADSVAFDLHKWLYMPFEAGCILVRSESAHRLAFSLTPSYLAHAERGVAAGERWFSDYGVQLTRGFRALKAWLSFKEHGIDRYRRMIHKNVLQARYLAGLIDRAPELELMAPVPLNIVCFRYNPGGMDKAALSRLNEEIMLELHERGLAVPSYTTLNGDFVLRVANVNHRSQRSDFDFLAQSVISLGRELSAAG
ncbi:MAG: aminotransferase class V-fold PLP-dependent enzyme [Caldilineales bacterium]|nr:aminotransferase class V-fold PLP-dependent enzyme [Caldilineales bacterium]